MATQKVKKELLQEALDLISYHVRYTDASAASGIAVSTLKNRVTTAIKEGMTPEKGVKKTEDPKFLRNQIKNLKLQLKESERQEDTLETVKNEILRLSHLRPKIPDWTFTPGKKSKNLPGVPTLFMSDLHWGEVVFSDQVGGKNAFNPRIAKKRVRTLIENTIHLLKDHMVNPEYPGIVLALGGDMFSGDIHDELKESNAQTTLESVVDLYGVMVWVIEELLKHFPKIFIPCVTGNHGRMTKKVQHKNRVYSNFDWQLYKFLEKHYHPVAGKKDPRVEFQVSDGSDAYYRIFNHRYLLTHGDQFRGGDGMIGPLGPIMRGDFKKRSRNSQIDMDYETMILGHFHTLMMLPKLIVNGSIKGLDEYAWAGNFSYEVPAQALWMTHPRNGITFSMPVYVDKMGRDKKPTEWVSFAK